MAWLIVGCMIPSMAVCWAAAFALRRWGPRWGLVDRPGHRKIHSAPMPTAGGLAVWLGIVLPSLAGQIALWILAADQTLIPLPDFVAPHISGLLHRSGKLWELLAGGTALMALGLVDDRRGLGLAAAHRRAIRRSDRDGLARLADEPVHRRTVADRHYQRFLDRPGWSIRSICSTTWTASRPAWPQSPPPCSPQ